MPDLSWMSFLGLARRAGFLVIGQDNVFAVLQKNKKNYVVIMTSDRSDAVARKAKKEAFSRHSFFQLRTIDRERLGEAIGLAGCQIVALPEGEGLTDTVILRLKEGGEAIE
ncbi:MULTISPECIES: hypothetical protein [Dethiosulfovibrio]|uniref:Ribosomal protein L7Ae/L30e/S12e/Gadd45 domain-containing protein n=2 Tax=Dethiosulfovibrio TaxID=47054 RepID=A0ABS9ELI7_9BACT|nr:MULTISPECIES: hypothetical protein [Dethiosulfovibrio]MCF4113601.1 hypothetical protein [Dethiosulfovibrio russensis]MCF4142071.1 hypothetical protein [Dethiosulfovibrio marinus]MCF4144226.1 hypothetical protein [Dethiosulfovibrio acidaminovorans]